MKVTSGHVRRPKIEQNSTDSGFGILCTVSTSVEKSSLSSSLSDSSSLGTEVISETSSTIDLFFLNWSTWPSLEQDGTELSPLQSSLSSVEARDIFSRRSLSCSVAEVPKQEVNQLTHPSWSDRKLGVVAFDGFVVSSLILKPSDWLSKEVLFPQDTFWNESISFVNQLKRAPWFAVEYSLGTDTTCKGE